MNDSAQNERRADRAEMALTGEPYMIECEGESAVSDILSDLMHLVERANVYGDEWSHDFDYLLVRARRNYAIERTEVDV